MQSMHEESKSRLVELAASYQEALDELQSAQRSSHECKSNFADKFGQSELEKSKLEQLLQQTLANEKELNAKVSLFRIE